MRNFRAQGGECCRTTVQAGWSISLHLSKVSLYICEVSSDSVGKLSNYYIPSRSLLVQLTRGQMAVRWGVVSRRLLSAVGLGPDQPGTLHSHMASTHPTCAAAVFAAASSEGFMTFLG